ncbi:MAG: hypothetical protein K9L02_07555 [Acholeplasmataceae bacterium]|nr:hypothetical protein [Acholeplasmataceae bacterium]
MRKLIIFYIMLIMFLLAGCASQEQIDITSIYGSLDFSFSTMTFTDTSENDILYQMGNSTDDFIILYQIITNETLNPSMIIPYRTLFTIMDELVTAQGIDYLIIESYSSLEFKEVCDLNSIELSIADIVTFNSFKSDLARIKEIESDFDEIISKLSYIEMRLDRVLSSSEVSDLNLLQDHYSELKLNHMALPILEYTFEELLLEFKNQIFYEPNETDQNRLEDAYDIITSLTA